MSIYHIFIIILLLFLGLPKPHNDKTALKCKCDQPIRDVNRDVLIQMAESLNTTYLGIHRGKPKRSFDVKIMGLGTRIYTSLPVRVRQKGCETQFNVIFLIDTGSPHTYLTAQTLNTLYMKCIMPQEIFQEKYYHGGYQVKIAGVNLKAEESDGSSKNVNILGGDFMTLAGAELHVNYISQEKDYASLKITPLKEHERISIDRWRSL